MAFHIRDDATHFAGRKLARLKVKTLTETVREAAEQEYAALSQTPPLIERLEAVHAQFQALKRPGGRPADKAFFDDLSGRTRCSSAHPYRAE